MPLPETFTMSRNGARFFASRLICDSSIEQTNQRWWDTLQLHPFTIVISGDFQLDPTSGAISVRVSNGVLNYTVDGKAILAPPPDGDTNFPTLGPDTIMTPYSVLSDGPYRYVMIHVQGLLAGTVRASWSAAVTVGEKG